MDANAALKLGLGLQVAIPAAFALATVGTTVWYWGVYVPRIVGED